MKNDAIFERGAGEKQTGESIAKLLSGVLEELKRANQLQALAISMVIPGLDPQNIGARKD